MKPKQTPDLSKLPPRPKEPDPSHCCGRGCERCIFVYYEEALARWHKRVKAAEKEMAECGVQTKFISP